MDQYEQVKRILDDIDWKVLTGQLDYSELQHLALTYSRLLKETTDTAKYVQQLIREARGDE